LRGSEIYVVFFSLNGGMGTPLEARSVTAGGLSTLPAALRRRGCYFSGLVHGGRS